jgi:tetratricopeptide (TPR) repeat protein
MTDVRRALEAELLAEQEFVADARASEKAPKQWPAALLMFHVSMWRERLRDALIDLRDERPSNPLPQDIDSFNDAELANGIGTPLTDAAARSELLHHEIMALNEAIGERAFKWFRYQTTTEAVLRASYMHPRTHMYEYLRENGNQQRALELFEQAAVDMRDADAPPLIMGAALYNLAVVRAGQSKSDDALTLLGEAIAMRPDLKESATTDPDFAALRETSGFQKLIS